MNFFSRLGGFSLSLALVSVLGAEPAGGPVVAVTGGQILGTALERGGAAFRGVPFAAPPVGMRRWQPPQPVPGWTGVRAALAPGAPAAQADAGWNKAFAAASSEDCLYLDVWTPELKPAAPLPVMVWIHGGGNVAGAGGADPLYDGRALIRHGVILVVIEYRLGIFAFFAHPDLSREARRHVSGNYGLLDQLAALHWVHDNIARFGGDPGNVTLFGQSAGAIDVFALLASPLSAGLVHRGIAESGPLAPGMIQTREAAEQAGLDAFRDQGGRPLPLAALRGLSTEELLRHGLAPKPFTVDGWVFKESPLVAWRLHHESAVPLIAGANAVEFPFAGSAPALAAAIRATLGPDAERGLALYDPAAAPDPRYGSAADQWGSDFFRCLPMVVTGWHAQAGRAAWQYEFDRAIPPKPKTAHSADLAYVFGNLSPTGSLPGEFTAADRELSGLIQGYWTNFAKTGNPNGPGLPPWEQVRRPDDVTMDFTEQGRTATLRGPRAPQRALFESYLERSAR